MGNNVIAFLEDDTADGGLGMVFRSLANYFSNEYCVYYISTRSNNGRIPDKIKYIQFAEKGSFEDHTNGIKRSLSGVHPLKKILKQYKPDMIISFGLYSNIRICLASIGMPYKVLISERGNASRFRGIYRVIVSILLARANRIVFQSKAALSAYPKLLRKKGIVINNAIFKNDLPDCSNMTWDNRIVSVGRIHPDKNFQLLLRAYHSVLREFPQTKLEIFGEEEPGSPGSYLQQLELLADGLNIKDHVFFMGHSNCIGNDIAGARLFVLPSVLEGMPNALIEAMACGIPCVSTDFLPGCAGEIITDGVDGCICANNDVESLAEKMKAVLSDSDLSRGMAHQSIKIRHRLSKNVIFNMWKQAIDIMFGTIG